MFESLNDVFQRYIDSGELAGCSLVIRQRDKVMFQGKWGYADLARKTPLTEDSVFRLMSMTKCVIAAGVLQLMESGKIALDDPISKFLPEFAEMRAAADPRYEYHPGMGKLAILSKVLFFDPKKVKTETAKRPITIRDLLTHSCGLEQGVVGVIQMLRDKTPRTTLKQNAAHYAKQILGFQPGEGTGYSPIAAFDLLGYIIEIVSGKKLERYLQDEIFEPLQMKHTSFTAPKEGLVRLYCRKGSRLVDVTGTKKDTDGFIRKRDGYASGSGGLYGTLEDYEHFAHMLLNNGEYSGKAVLRPETVRLMRTEGPKNHLEPDPGFVWGLGVKIRQNPSKTGNPCTPGTYGWSGAFGTHFFISPADELECVFMTNRSDLNGSGSYISKRLEELVFSQLRG